MKAALILAAIFLIGCTPRGEMAFAPAAPGGAEQQVFVSTTRKREAVVGEFGSERSETVTYAQFGISIPPDREVGEINWPKGGREPDPITDFVVTDQTIYNNATEFRGELSEKLQEKGREATIFVHGYNNNFSEGLYRIAQLSSDLDLPGVAVHYSWPSIAKPLGYVTDRDSAAFSRDGLTDLIGEVKRSGADKIYLVAHSMGSLLTMEALRAIAIAQDDATMDRIAGVILISPDIDVDVFRSQALEIGKLPDPFVIFGSDRDRILRLSGRLTGQRDRLGTLQDLGRVADLKVTYLDVGAFTEGSGHFDVGDSAALIRLFDRIGDVDRAFNLDAAGRTGLLPGLIITAQSATRVVLQPVVDLSQQ
ncbi:MAG: alpha/beta hydrolase [Paracoccaceae bacterium]